MQRRRAALRGREIDHRLVARDEFRRGDGLVQLEREFQRRALDRGDAPRVRDLLGREAGVRGIIQLRVRAFEPRKLEDAQLEFARALLAVFDAIRKVRRHLRQRPAENRVGQILRERNAPLLPLRRREHERRVCGHESLELREHHHAAAAFDGGVPRRHRHARFHRARQRRHRRGQCDRPTRERKQPDAQPEHRQTRALHAQQTLVQLRAPARAFTVRDRLRHHAFLQKSQFSAAIRRRLLERRQQQRTQIRMLLLDQPRRRPIIRRHLPRPPPQHPARRRRQHRHQQHRVGHRPAIDFLRHQQRDHHRHRHHPARHPPAPIAQPPLHFDHGFQTLLKLGIHKGRLNSPVSYTRAGQKQSAAHGERRNERAPEPEPC